MKQNKAKTIERLMRLTYSSLESHLSATYLKTPDGIAFHKQCVREYAEMIQLLAKLL